VKRVRDGIYENGGIPLEFPIHPIQETGKRPTASLDRNLSYLSLVEVLYGYPLDGVVLTIGCDKTTPACLMAAALRHLNWDDMTDYLPAIVTAVAMPFTFSIATGIGLGFITYALVKTVAGKPGEVSGAVWLIALASVAKKYSPAPRAENAAPLPACSTSPVSDALMEVARMPVALFFSLMGMVEPQRSRTPWFWMSMLAAVTRSSMRLLAGNGMARVPSCPRRSVMVSSARAVTWTIS
jgi:hypothetical protein